MKKILAIVLAIAMVFCFAACGNKEEAPADIHAKGEGVMTFADYDKAALDSSVVIEAFVQDHQSWWDNKITVYAQDKDGAYFLYNMACSEEDAAKLVPGTKIKVTGTKSEWSGEVEIVDATFEFEEGSWTAEATDVTSLLGTDNLIKEQNKFVSMKGMTVLAYNEGSDEGFAYKSSRGDDLYFRVAKGNAIIELCVESYLRGQDTDVYKAVEGLKAGDLVDIEGFLYWYNGANPHVTGLTVTGSAKSAGAMTYAAYAAAPVDSAVVVDCFVQDHQSWWDNKITAYAQDYDGAYFLYNMACTEDDAKKLVPGTRILVKGTKSEWSGEVEIVDATFEFAAGADSYVAEARQVVAEDDLEALQNQLVCFRDATIVPYNEGGKEGFAYKSSKGDDLYFKADCNGSVIEFCVESYLRGEDTDVYKAVEGLQIGDTVDVEGFLYWYNGANPHVVNVTVK